MHLRFTDEELATMVEMVSLATEMANLNPNDEGNAGFARFEAIENKVLEAAKHTGMAEIVEYDLERGKNRVTEKFQESSFFQQCFDEFRNAVFWEELMARLADRDLTQEMGQAAYLALNEEQRQERLEPIEKRYWTKFQNEGMNPLFWIDRNEDA
jgi:glutamine cyclotransferase